MTAPMEITSPTNVQRVRRLIPTIMKAVIPPGSTDVTVQRLADAMVSLATDHDRVLQLGAAGKQHIAANYLWPHIVGIYHNLHTEISEQ